MEFQSESAKQTPECTRRGIPPVHDFSPLSNEAGEIEIYLSGMYQPCIKG